MVLCLVPIGSGFVKNFHIVGEGGSYDAINCIYKQGTWSNNKLNGGTVYTNFFNPIVNIKVGPYSENQPNGTFSEYTFDKTSWVGFIANPPAGIAATKNINVYTAGVLTSTTSTSSVNISGTISKNLANNVIGFTFVEV